MRPQKVREKEEKKRGRGRRLEKKDALRAFMWDIRRYLQLFMDLGGKFAVWIPRNVTLQVSTVPIV